ncbi:hypothetical protein BV898_00592 [Hypsibius exemplaris]|uniref:Uncharacterized protein n=1 Tax=Hypsibius exemplaris TaxID=2072580 RepID=A0A1W0XDW6_HYPEX|nr:hypothetical protein BV898_00592 [Hypsibius exemplaris]
MTRDLPAIDTCCTCRKPFVDIEICRSSLVWSRVTSKLAGKFVFDLLMPALSAAEVNTLIGSRDAGYPKNNTIPDTKFSCASKAQPGFHADVEAQCPVFHHLPIWRTSPTPDSTPSSHCSTALLRTTFRLPSWSSFKTKAHKPVKRGLDSGSSPHATLGSILVGKQDVATTIPSIVTGGPVGNNPTTTASTLPLIPVGGSTVTTAAHSCGWFHGDYCCSFLWVVPR